MLSDSLLTKVFFNLHNIWGIYWDLRKKFHLSISGPVCDLLQKVLKLGGHLTLVQVGDNIKCSASPNPLSTVKRCRKTQTGSTGCPL